MNPTDEGERITLLDVVVKLAVLSEKMNAMESRLNKSSHNVLSTIAIIISALVLIVNFGGQVTWK